jgi:signal transduction histidine kinase
MKQGVLAALFLAASAGTPAPARADQPAILLLITDNPGHSALRAIEDGFRQRLQQTPDSPALFTEYLDAARFADPAHLERLRDWFRSKYARRRIDLIAAAGQEVVAFLAQQRGEPWPNVPIMYLELGGLTIDVSDRLADVTGVILEDSFATALRTAKELFPDTERIGLLYGGSDVERARYGPLVARVRELVRGVDGVDLGGLSMPDLVDRVRSLPGRMVIFHMAIEVDAAGRTLPTARSCQLISDAANRPLFGLGAQDFGCGMVGGLMRDWTKAGQLFAERALTRLSGEPVATVTVELSRYTMMAFDARQLERWGVSRSRLPANAIVQFRPPSLWRDYRPQAIAALSVGLIQLLLIIGLLIEHRRRQRAERTARGHLATMSHMDRRAALGQLAASLAHELGQPLSSIRHNAGAADVMLERGGADAEELRAILSDIRSEDTRAVEIIRRMRALLERRELSTVPVDLNDVVRDTVRLVSSDAAHRGVDVEMELAGIVPRVAGDRVHLQQVLLNLLLNGVHATSGQPPDRRKVVVRTAAPDGVVEVAISDRGHGIAPDQLRTIFQPFVTTKSDGLGVGLSISRTIVEAHGGRIAAENNPDGGATVRFSLPVPPAVRS